MNLFSDDSFRFVAMRPSGLEDVMESIAKVIEPYLPGEDPALHIAALLTVEAGAIQITIEARTDLGREALQRLAAGVTPE